MERCHELEKTLEAFEAATRQTEESYNPSKGLRVKRDGPGVCGTFVIFPFLAFLWSALSTSVTLINNVNNNI